MRYRTFLFWSLAAVFCFAAAPFSSAAGGGISAPTVLSIEDKGLDRFEPVVTGLTPAGTEVLIYIDGVYAGLADIGSQDTASDSFAFAIKDVKKAGEHEVMAVARNRTSLLLSPPAAVKFQAPSLPAPTLIAPDERTVTAKVKPVITGLTKSGTKVHIYIDRIYNGATDVRRHPSGTADFAYRPFLNLEVGRHTVVAVAEDENGRQSVISKPLGFKIEKPYPAPTLVSARRSYDENRPLIAGLAKNDSVIRVYIDHALDGAFAVRNNDSGTANFAYRPFLPLRPGSHVVYAEAVDARGKVSAWSNARYFTVASAAMPEITPVAASEKSADADLAPAAAGSGGVTAVVPPAEEVAVLGEENDLTGEKTAGAASGELESLIAKAGKADQPGTGLLDESQRAQGGLQFNLIIFILFLLAVIAWIFWVNRELIKERRELMKMESGQGGKSKLL